MVIWKAINSDFVHGKSDSFQANFRVLSILWIFVVSLTGCNLGMTPSTIQSTDITKTDVVQTVLAQITKTVNIQTQTPTVKSTSPGVVGSKKSIPPTSTLKPTITNSPSVTNTPTQLLDKTSIFIDDFLDSSLWYTYREDDYGFSYESGGYYVYSYLAKAAIWSIRELELAHVLLEVDVSFREMDNDGYAGVLCRFANEGKDYYFFVIGVNGLYGIGKMEEGGIYFLQEGRDQDDIISDTNANHIRGECSGNRLSLYINGQQMLEVWDDTFTNGDVGIIVGNKSIDGKAAVLFDNFSIYYP